MTIIERIDFYQKFNEESELGDAVGAILSGASILGGLGDENNAQLALVIVENLIKEYIEWAKKEGDYWMYEEINDDIYRHFTNGANKMTESELEAYRDTLVDNMDIVKTDE